jgi:uncharacterized membrane protein
LKETALSKKKTSKKDIVLKKKHSNAPLKIIIPVGAVVAAAVVSILLFTGNRGGAVAAAGGQQSGNEIMFSAELFSNGDARYFEQDFASGTVRYFLLQSKDGVVRAAFDACDVCFRSKRGYMQTGDLMVCNNCGQAFPAELINVEKGGCNPAPLDREVRGDSVVIQVTDIEQGLRFF